MNKNNKNLNLYIIILNYYNIFLKLNIIKENKLNYLLFNFLYLVLTY